MHNYSKGYRRFKGRVEYFLEDIETAFVVVKHKELLAGDDHIFKGVSPKQPKLFKRQNTPGSRTNVVYHMRNTLYVSFLKDLYEEVMLYFEYAIYNASLASLEPTKLIGGQNNLTFKISEILSQNTKEDIFQMISRRIFRTVESKKDTLELVRLLNDRLNLEVDEDCISSAMPYLETRHKLIHADGIADELFIQKYPQICLDGDGRIKIDYTFIRKAYSRVDDLLKEYDKCLKKNNMFLVEEFQ